jgi:hypothetical protein
MKACEFISLVDLLELVCGEEVRLVDQHDEFATLGASWATTVARTDRGFIEATDAD